MVTLLLAISIALILSSLIFIVMHRSRTLKLPVRMTKNKGILTRQYQTTTYQEMSSNVEQVNGSQITLQQRKSQYQQVFSKLMNNKSQAPTMWSSPAQ